MDEASGESDLTLKTLDRVTTRQLGAKHLDGDRTIEVMIAAAVDDGHAAGSDFFFDAEAGRQLEFLHPTYFAEFGRDGKLGSRCGELLLSASGANAGLSSEGGP
jgi:hypothetical protein